MKNIFLLIGLLLKLQTAFASMNYFIYHQKIIYAEELFLKDSIQASLIAYKNIFTEYKPFAKDAFIALELACMRKDTAQSIYFFEQCFKSGVNWDVFDKVLYIKDILDKNIAYHSHPELLAKVCLRGLR